MFIKLRSTIKNKIIKYNKMKIYKKTCILGKKILIDPDTVLEGRNLISSGSKLCNCYFGYGSYTNKNTVLYNAKVGKYTCIASNVRIVSGTHPTSKFVSLHPAFYSAKKQIGFTYTDQTVFAEDRYVDEEHHYAVTIGNDVWVGMGVLIRGGVCIGDGAIIAMGSVVVKDVPPYAIVGGNPAKIIRYRFDIPSIQFLLEFKWWNQPEDWIKDHIQYFHNIEDFIGNFNEYSEDDNAVFSKN